MRRILVFRTRIVGLPGTSDVGGAEPSSFLFLLRRHGIHDRRLALLLLRRSGIVVLLFLLFDRRRFFHWLRCNPPPLSERRQINPQFKKSRPRISASRTCKQHELL